MATFVDLALNNTTWDLYTENRDLATVDGVDAIKQNLRQKLQTFYQENEFDISAGLPYFQEIFKKNPNPLLIRAAFVDAIINTPGILEITNIEFDLDSQTRILSVDFRCISTSGVVDYSFSTAGLI
jgi:hypothetical protein